MTDGPAWSAVDGTPGVRFRHGHRLLIHKAGRIAGVQQDPPGAGAGRTQKEAGSLSAELSK